MEQMDDKYQARLGAVQETLFIPLAARARETQQKHPVLRDPKAAEMVRSIDYDTAKYGRGAGGFVTVRPEHPVRAGRQRPGALVRPRPAGHDRAAQEISSPTPGRRRMVAASVLGEDWLPAVAQSQGPYFFVAEGVLVYLPEDQVMAALAWIAARFPGALIALDTYPKQTFDQQHKLAARKGIDARWAWACDDPRSLERFGLQVRQSATLTRPPRAMRAQLPFRYRYLVPLADPFVGKAMTLTLFRASSPAAVGRAATAREARPA
jgi:O-methyltransferase involved in polyketide biosynthesis